MKFLFQYIAVFAVYVPVGAVLIYIIDRGFSKDLRVNIIFLHATLAVLTQLAMVLMGLAAIENIIIMKVYLCLEMFLVVFLYFQFNSFLSRNIKLISSVLLAVITFALSFLTLPNYFPYYSIIFNGIVLLVGGSLILRNIDFRNNYERGFAYFTLGIIIYSIGYSTSYLYLDILPALAVRVQAVLNIIKYILITMGIYQFYRYLEFRPVINNK